MKRCPFCAEDIQDEALKCRYCGEFLKKQFKLPGCVTGCLIVLAVLILMGIVFFYFSYFVLDSLRYKIMAMQANMSGGPHFGTPFNPGGIQTMFKDLGEGFKVFGDFLNGNTTKDLQNYKF